MYRKIEVKPFIDTEMKEILYKLKFITKRSVNNICESLCTNAIQNNAVADLKKHFRRNVQINNIYFEASNRPVPLEKSSKLKTERISLQLDDTIYEVAYMLAFAIGCSVAKAVALLLKKSMEDKRIITKYFDDFILEKLNRDEHKHLSTIADEISKISLEENWYLNHEQAIAALVYYVYEEVKEPEESIENALLKASNSCF